MMRVRVQPAWGLGATPSRPPTEADVYCPASMFPPPGSVERTAGAVATTAEAAAELASKTAGAAGKVVDIGGKVVGAGGKVVDLATTVIGIPEKILKKIGLGQVAISEGEVMVTRGQAQIWASDNACKEAVCRNAMTGQSERFYTCLEHEAQQAQAQAVYQQSVQKAESQKKLSMALGVGGLAVGAVLLFLAFKGGKE